MFCLLCFYFSNNSSWAKIFLFFSLMKDLSKRRGLSSSHASSQTSSSIFARDKPAAEEKLQNLNAACKLTRLSHSSSPSDGEGWTWIGRWSAVNTYEFFVSDSYRISSSFHSIETMNHATENSLHQPSCCFCIQKCGLIIFQPGTSFCPRASSRIMTDS